MLRVKSVKSDKEIQELEDLLEDVLSIEVNERGNISRVIVQYDSKPAVTVAANFSELVVSVQRSITKYNLGWKRNVDGRGVSFCETFDTELERKDFINDKLSDLDESELTLSTSEEYDD